MSLPISRIVNVTVLTSPQFPAVPGFGLTCFITPETQIPVGQRLRIYDDLLQVGEDWGTNTETYLMAEIFFSQSPTPSQLAIARWFYAATAGQLMSGTPNLNLPTYTALSSASLSLSIDTGAINLTGINLSGAASLNAVAALIQTALQVADPLATVTFDGQFFYVTSGTTGSSSSVSFATTPGSGFDLGPLMALRQSDSATSTVGSAAETLTQALQNINEYNANWYYFALANTVGRPIVDADFEAAALWSEANQKILGWTSPEAGLTNSASTTDIGYVLSQSEYSRSFGQWDPVNKYSAVSALARISTVDFTQPNSTITLKFKVEPGVQLVQPTQTQANALEAKNVNYNTQFGLAGMLVEGVVASGRFLDEVVGLDWLSQYFQNVVLAFLYTTTTKIPQTDPGVARIVQVITAAAKDAVNNGLLAPGYWKGAPVGQKNTGDFLDKGFYVFAAPVADQSQIQRDARIAPPITIIACGAGAIHEVNITINFQR